MSFRRSSSSSTAATFPRTTDVLDLASSSSQICNCFFRSLSFRGKTIIPWPILVSLIMSAKREEVNSSIPICASFKYCSCERSYSRASCLRMNAISSFLPIASAVRLMIDCTRCRLRAMSSSNIFNLSCLTLGIEGEEEEDSNFALTASSFVIIGSLSMNSSSRYASINSSNSWTVSMVSESCRNYFINSINSFLSGWIEYSKVD